MPPTLRHPNCTPPKECQRRKFTCHRYIERLYIGKENGIWFTAMIYEISVGGLSAATTTDLAVGEKVRLSPVVRQKNGAMYRFEFIGVTEPIQTKLEKTLRRTPSVPNFD